MNTSHIKSSALPNLLVQRNPLTSKLGNGLELLLQDASNDLALVACNKNDLRGRLYIRRTLQVTEKL